MQGCCEGEGRKGVVSALALGYTATKLVQPGFDQPGYADSSPGGTMSSADHLCLVQ